MTVAHPSWLPYGLAVVMVVVSVYCVGRLVLANRLGRRNHRDISTGHVLMGAGMVGMLVPGWNVAPDGVWEVVFGVLSLYFLAQSVRFVSAHGLRGADDNDVHHLSHFLIHMVMGCAMLYMYWLGMPLTARANPGMAMSSSAGAVGDPALTLLLVAVLFASAVWQLDSVHRFSPQGLLALSAVRDGGGGHAGPSVAPAADRPWLAPRLEIWCHIAMCFTMGYMLVLMV